MSDIVKNTNDIVKEYVPFGEAKLPKHSGARLVLPGKGISLSGSREVNVYKVKEAGSDTVSALKLEFLRPTLDGKTSVHEVYLTLDSANALLQLLSLQLD